MLFISTKSATPVSMRVYRITGPDVVGETGVEFEGGNEVLDEHEEEGEAVVHSCSRRRTKWIRAVRV